MKKNSVDWLVNELQKANYIPKDSIIMNAIIDIARKIHKNEIKNALYKTINANSHSNFSAIDEYYNETFKQQEQ
jgi:hypothetical protein